MYMLLAVFNDNYAAMLGNIDGTGSGDTVAQRQEQTY